MGYVSLASSGGLKGFVIDGIKIEFKKGNQSSKYFSAKFNICLNITRKNSNIIFNQVVDSRTERLLSKSEALFRDSKYKSLKMLYQKWWGIFIICQFLFTKKLTFVRLNVTKVSYNDKTHCSSGFYYYYVTWIGFEPMTPSLEG